MCPPPFSLPPPPPPNHHHHQAEEEMKAWVVTQLAAAEVPGKTRIQLYNTMHIMRSFHTITCSSLCYADVIIKELLWMLLHAVLNYKFSKWPIQYHNIKLFVLLFSIPVAVDETEQHSPVTPKKVPATNQGHGDLRKVAMTNMATGAVKSAKGHLAPRNLAGSPATSSRVHVHGNAARGNTPRSPAPSSRYSKVGCDNNNY